MPNIIITEQNIYKKIYVIREHRVMLDNDLAELYQVPTKVFNQAVKRNAKRFPPDFMFQLTKEELGNWRSQFVTSKPTLKMGLRYKPYAFTELGVAMLSSVLNSNRAIEVNIQIMRAFVKLRKMLLEYADLRKKIESMERKYDTQFKTVFEAIKCLLNPPEPPKKSIGFTVKP